MLRVVEAFSGIGSQAKALKNIGADFEILNTIEWDINAILAYDIIHNGRQDLKKYDEWSNDDLIAFLSNFTLSGDGKEPLDKDTYKKMKRDFLKRIVSSIERTNNLVSITDIKARDLPNNIDLLTYSFPCQDLSTGALIHGNTSGLDKNAHNRSGMLWEIERILKESRRINKETPRFLLMENVSNILSDRHRSNFDKWCKYLSRIGYINQIYTLDASNFGIPQKRFRTFMISVRCDNQDQHNRISEYFRQNNLERNQHNNGIQMKNVKHFLRTNYNKKIYKEEAEESCPNWTPSRREIFLDNDILVDENGKYFDKPINTITTKQDRNPNSGIVLYDSDNPKKAKFRYLTPRECFLFMGFDENDYQLLMDNNFLYRNNNFFSKCKLVKMAGNSIVVNVLEEVFKQIIEIKEEIL